MAYEATPFDTYTTKGLTEAQGLLDKSLGTQFTYPQYVSSAQNAPTQQNYYNYTPTAPLAQIQAPNYTPSGGQYQGLMNGDYDQLQSALTTPGASAAGTAYNQGYNTLNNVMGGRGLYGSSIMQNQATNNLDSVYQQALANNAANAAANRYQLQQAGLVDLNKYNMSREQQLNQYNQANTQLNQTQALNTQQAQANEAARQMAYNQGNMQWNQTYQDQMTNWQNQQKYEKYLYDVTRQQAQTADTENKMNQALSLTGAGAPLANMASQANISAQNLANQRYIADQNANAANTSGWLGALGALGGGLLGNESVGKLGMSLYNAIP